MTGIWEHKGNVENISRLLSNVWSKVGFRLMGLHNSYSSQHQFCTLAVLFFGILTVCFVEFDTSVICHAVLILCLVSSLLQIHLYLSIGFEGQSLKYSVSLLLSCIQNMVDNWNPQADSHVMSSCRWWISGLKALLLSLPSRSIASSCWSFLPTCNYVCM